MMFPKPKPATGITGRAGTNQIAESLATARIMRTPGMQETTNGTMQLVRRLRPTAIPAAELPRATVLYKVLAVREYDENGSLVAVGSESYPSLATGHTLRWTEDWLRMGST